MPSTPPNNSLQTPQAAWPLVRLGDFTTKIGSGSTPRGGEAVYLKKGVALIRSMNVHFDGLRPEGLAFITKAEGEKLKNVTVQEGDVLLNITGASIGRVTTVPGELAGARVNQHVCIIRPTAELHPKFLANFFATPVEQMRIHDCQVGATRQALTKQMIEDWQVPLPPMEEQQRIVVEIEKQFTRLEFGLAALRRVQASLKRYRAAVLKAACEGRLVPTEAELARADSRLFESGQQLLARILTERRQNWHSRGKYKETLAPDRKNVGQLAESWAWASVDQLAYETMIGLDRGRDQQSAAPEAGVPYIKMNNVTMDGRVKCDSLVFVPASREEAESYSLKDGDILFNTRNSKELVGKVGIVRCPPSGAVYNNNLMRIRLPKGVLPAFLAFQMCSQEFRQRMDLVKKATTSVAAVYAKDLLPLAIALPPLAEQTRIVAEVERRWSVVEELEAMVTTNLQRARRLRGSILAAEFRSERHADQGALLAKVKPAPSSQNVKPIRQIISPMKKHLKLSPDSLVETVKRNKGRMTPADLCLASNVEEQVEGFFEVLRECRDCGLLIVPSGIGGIIKLVKS